MNHGACGGRQGGLGDGTQDTRFCLDLTAGFIERQSIAVER